MMTRTIKSVLMVLLLTGVGPAHALGETDHEKLRVYIYEADFDDALKLAERLIAQGDPAGLDAKALLLHEGFGTAKDENKAAELLKLATEKGFGPAMVPLAAMHLRSEGGLSDRAEGLRLLERAAALSDPQTDGRLSALYVSSGNGIPRDYKKALLFAERATAKDDVSGHATLGRLYWFGLGVEKDERKATQHFRIAAKQKHPTAMTWLGQQYLRERDLRDAYRSLKAPVQHRIPAAEAMMGVMYLYGGRRFDANPKKGIALLKSAAENGSAKAQFELGEAYTKGRGVPASNTLAAEWYVKAAKSYIESDDREEAVVTVDRLEQVAPGSPEARQLRAKLGHGTSTATASEPSTPTEISGTGWVIEPGYIVTNHHVVEGARAIRVGMANGKSHEATVRLADPSNDIAILEVKRPSQLPPAIPLTRSGLRAGERVFTVGFPIAPLMGAEAKVTEGIISSTRGYLDDPRLYQISVPIQPGNSGGPLLNMKGEVVGVVTAQLAAAKVFRWTGSLPQNVNYAVKIDYARLLTQSLKANNRTTLARQDASLDTLAARVRGSVVQILTE